MGKLAPFLGIDPSTLTAAVKPLARRGLLTVEPDPTDGRARRLRITSEGVALIREAVDVWEATHAEVTAELEPKLTDALRRGLGDLGETASARSG